MNTESDNLWTSVNMNDIYLSCHCMSFFFYLWMKNRAKQKVKATVKWTSDLNQVTLIKCKKNIIDGDPCMNLIDESDDTIHNINGLTTI